MKYIGYTLFLLVFILVSYVDTVKNFFVAALDLAPEITYLIAFFYCYITIMAIVLGIFPNLVKSRTSVLQSHLAMACSVMVSLGLVGTFLGLVDMISGIGAALTSDATDFAKRMENLLSAISSSLGAMSFAFMTSILGVGISAYSMVAGNFVITSFSEGNKNEENDNINTYSYDFEKEISHRLDFLEGKISNLTLCSIESDVTPLIMFDALTKQNDKFINDIVAITDKKLKSAERIEAAFCKQEESRNLLIEEMKINNAHLVSLSRSLDDFIQAHNKSSFVLEAGMKKNYDSLESIKESTNEAVSNITDFKLRMKKILS